jgi:hypothetical protein
MSNVDLDERRIVRLLRSAHRLEPLAADYEAVSARVRVSLLNQRTPRNRFVLRRMVLTGVAAAIVLAASALAVILLATHTSPAWAELQAATETSSDFRGWVSMSTDSPAAAPFRIFDTESGSSVAFESSDPSGNRSLRFIDHRNATDSYWSAATGTVFVSELSPSELEMTYARDTQRLGNQLDFRELLKAVEPEMARGDLDLSAHRDGEFDRFDLNLYRRDNNGIREAAAVDAMSYWVEPKTHLIRKVRHLRRDQKPSTVLYGYNNPRVRDIHDLGVPPNAKVVDRRATGLLKERLDALDQRIESRTGDGVAVICTVTTQQNENSKEPVLDALEIYGQSGNRWVWAEYLVGRTMGRDSVGNGNQRPQLEPPPGWPQVDPRVAIELVRGLQPNDLFIRNADRSVRSFKGNGVNRAGHPASSQDAAYFGVPGLYWPGRFKMQIYSPWAATTLHSGDVEKVEVNHFEEAGVHRYASFELTLSNQTGLPLTFSHRVYDAQNVERLAETWSFLDSLQTPAGVRLPRRWIHRSYSLPDSKESLVRESTLSFDRGLRVPEAWFDVPSNGLGRK